MSIKDYVKLERCDSVVLHALLVKYLTIGEWEELTTVVYTRAKQARISRLEKQLEEARGSTNEYQ